VTDSTLSPADLLSAPAVASRLRVRTGRMVTAGLLLSLACVLGLVEAAFSTPFAGARLGLANIAVLVTLRVLGQAPALAVAVLRVLIVGLATGSLFGPSSALALAGAVAAWLAMSVALRSGVGFSYVGISVCGAFAHVVAQYAMAVVLTGVLGVLLLAPLSLVMSLLFGIVTGYLALYIISRVEVSRLPGR